MKTFDLKGTVRKDLGKKATKQVRKEDLIPCVLYGGESPVHFTAPINDFRHLLYTPHVFLVNLNIDEKPCQAVMQDVQFHPVSDAVLHIDFLLVTDESPVSIRIPVLTNGFALGVQDGGKLKVEMRRLKVKALPRYLPDSLDIDVTDIELGQSVKVRELDFENMELLDPRNSVVVSVKLTRVAKGMAAAYEEEEEEIEGEEGEESGEEASDSE